LGLYEDAEYLEIFHAKFLNKELGSRDRFTQISSNSRPCWAYVPLSDKRVEATTSGGLILLDPKGLQLCSPEKKRGLISLLISPHVQSYCVEYRHTWMQRA
jgi:hypothetical protein